jgi:hypothetical protein
MLLFGHIGITLGAAVLLANVLPSTRFSKTTGNEAIESSSSSSQVAVTLSNLPSHKGSWLAPLGNRIDIRLLLIGSLLPDIIDKPIGLLLFRETLSNGRIFCHTLLFLILITIAGLYLYRSRGRTYLLAVSFGILTHLILDQMWRVPRTLFWPVYGLTLDRMDVSDWMANILNALLTDPATYLPELLGVVILIWFAVTLLLRRKALSFLKSGQVQ